MKRAGHLFLRSEESVESIFLLFFRQIAVSLFFDKRFGLYFIFSTFVKLIKKRINMEFKIKGCIGALMMGCVFAACEDDTDKGGSDVDQPKEATYLLYMVGQNEGQ